MPFQYLEQRHKEEPTVELHVLQQELRDIFNVEVHPTTISRHRYKLGLVQVDPERLRVQEEREEQRRSKALQKLAERKVCAPSFCYSISFLVDTH